jgi:flagellar biosynthesis/type III secretory pathway chaperone
MEPGACREHLSQLLTDEISALTQLTGLLEREYALLTANEVSALESAMRERQSCVGRIVRLDEERRSLCRMLGHASDAQGLERLLHWCDPRRTLGLRWQEHAGLARRCRELNDRNGALVSARLKRVQALLGVLIGGARDSATYGRGGSYQPVSTGRVVATEV